MEKTAIEIIAAITGLPAEEVERILDNPKKVNTEITVYCRPCDKLHVISTDDDEAAASFLADLIERGERPAKVTRDGVDVTRDSIEILEGMNALRKLLGG